MPPPGPSVGCELPAMKMSSAEAPQIPVHSSSTVGPASARQSLHVPMFGTFASAPEEPDELPPPEEEAPLLPPPLLLEAPPSLPGTTPEGSSSPHAAMPATMPAKM